MGRGRNGTQRGPIDTNSIFASIFRPQSWAPIRHWLFRLKVPRPDRVDLAQDIMIAAFTSFPTYDPTRTRPERWLNQITVHIAARYHQRARHRREEQLPDDFDVACDIPSAEELLAGEEDRQFVLEVLQSIDSDERMVVIEHDIEGSSIAEIAARRGIPASTAYKRRARGIAAFREKVVRRLRSELAAGGEDAATVPVDGSIEDPDDRC